MAERPMPAGSGTATKQPVADMHSVIGARPRGIMTRRRWIIAALIAIVVLAAAGTGVWFVATRGFEQGPNHFVGASGSLDPGHLHYRYSTFSGLAREETSVTAGQTITVDYTLHATKGNLAVEVVDPAGNVVWNISVPRNQDQNGTTSIPVTVDGKYQVVLIGLNTGGNFDVSWSAK